MWTVLEYWVEHFSVFHCLIVIGRPALPTKNAPKNCLGSLGDWNRLCEWQIHWQSPSHLASRCTWKVRDENCAICRTVCRSVDNSGLNCSLCGDSRCNSLSGVEALLSGTSNGMFELSLWVLLGEGPSENKVLAWLPAAICPGAFESVMRGAGSMLQPCSESSILSALDLLSICFSLRYS